MYRFLCLMAGWVTTRGHMLLQGHSLFSLQRTGLTNSHSLRGICLLYSLVTATASSLHAYKIGCDSTSSHLASVCSLSCYPLAAAKPVLAWCWDISSQKPFCDAYYSAALSPGCARLSDWHAESLSCCAQNVLPKLSSHWSWFCTSVTQLSYDSQHLRYLCDGMNYPLALISFLPFKSLT